MEPAVLGRGTRTCWGPTREIRRMVRAADLPVGAAGVQDLG